MLWQYGWPLFHHGTTLFVGKRLFVRKKHEAQWLLKGSAPQRALSNKQ